MKTLNFENVVSSDATESTGVAFTDAVSSMTTTAKVVVGVGAAGLLTGAFFLGSWYAGRKADNTAAAATAQPAAAAPVPQVIPAAAASTAS